MIYIMLALKSITLFYPIIFLAQLDFGFEPLDY